MKKNLKKVLSAVIAMALAFSLVPASFAAKVTLSDVADTASYATAVNTLVALKVINGYEDGTFLPDNKITRAEATKVMVAALNQLDAAEGMKGATQFTDVESRHEWATGYINAGVQNGYINGMGDGTFAPDAEVTYAQMVKMLVSAMNYDQYAAYLGGYPTGYLSIAGSEGITDGVNANANDAVTRAQVAQLVYNALNAPIVENTGMTWTSDGKLVPTIAKQNGKKQGNTDTYYKSILTEYFNAYYVEGYVTETSKDGLENDEVKFGIAKTELYDHTTFGAKALYDNPKNSFAAVDGDTAREVKVFFGDTNAPDFKGVYASAIIMEDEYDDLTLVSFVPSGKNKSVKVDAKLVDSYDDISNEIEVYASENATKTTGYRLYKNDNNVVVADVYVNGYNVGNTADIIKQYVTGGKVTVNSQDTTYAPLNVGEVELVDTYKPDGYYDTIYVNTYATAIVSDVITSSKDIIFDEYVSAVEKGKYETKLTLDQEKDEKLEYKILYNGEEITLAELQKDDILSISYDVRKEFKGCNNFVIYVSRDVKTGKYTSKDADNAEVTIGGEVYGFVNNTIPTDMTLSNEYTIYVDAFGRIVKTDVNVSAARYAIVDRLIRNTGAYDGDRLAMYTAEGELKTLVLEDDADVYIGGTKETGSLRTAIEGVVGDIHNDPTTRTDIENRVVTYKVNNSTGFIKELTFLTADKTATTAEFKSDSAKISSIYMSDATKIVNAIQYEEKYNNQGHDKGKTSDLEIMSLSDLSDGTKYDAYAFDKVNGIHSFVLVTKGDDVYNEETRFAVIASTISEGTDDTTGETIYKVEVYGADSDEKIELTISEDAKYVGNNFATTDLSIGDVIVYRTGADGVVIDIEELYSVGADFTALADSVIASTATVNLPSANASREWTLAWTGRNSNTTEDPIRVMIGIVAEKKDKTMTLVSADGNYQTDLNGTAATGVYEIDLTDDTAVYTYDYSISKEASRVEKARTGAIIPTTLATNCYVDETKEVIDWSAEQSRENIKLAVVKTLDDEAIDVLYITGEYKVDNGNKFAHAKFKSPEDNDTYIDKKASGLGSNFEIAAGAITGQMKKIDTAWTGYNSDPAANTGYFVPVSFTADKAGTFTMVTKLNGSVVNTKADIATDAGEVWDIVIRVADVAGTEVADTIEFTFTATGAAPVTYTFALPEA